MKKILAFLLLLMAAIVAFGQYTPRVLYGDYQFVISHGATKDTVFVYPSQGGIILDTLFFADGTKQWSGLNVSDYMHATGDTVTGRYSFRHVSNSEYMSTAINKDTIKLISAPLQPISPASCTSQFFSNFTAAKILMTDDWGNEFKISAYHDCYDDDTISTTRNLRIISQSDPSRYISLEAPFFIELASDSISLNGDVRVDGQLIQQNLGCAAYLNTPDTTTITTAGTYYPIAGTFTNITIEGFTNIAKPAIRYDGAGTYWFEIDWHATIRANVASTTVHCGVKVGGSLITGSVMATMCKTANEEYTLSGTVVVELSTKEEIQLVVTSDGNGDEITFDHFTTTVRRFY